MKKNIPFLADCMFRTIMMQEEYLDFIQFLVCQITDLDENEVKNKFKILSPVLPIRHVENKQGIADVLYQVGENIFINLEANRDNEHFRDAKNHSYMCQIFTDKLKRGETYIDGKVIQINLNTFAKGKGNIGKYQMMDKLYHEVESEFFEKYHINLDKIKKSWYNGINQELTKLDRALILFVETNPKRLDMLAGDEEMFIKIVRRIKEMNKDDFIIGLYNKEEMDRLHLKYVEYAGEKRGEKKGEKKGRLKGIKENSYKIAKNLLKENSDISFIQRVTQLSPEEIKKIQLQL